MWTVAERFRLGSSLARREWWSRVDYRYLGTYLTLWVRKNPSRWEYLPTSEGTAESASITYGTYPASDSDSSAHRVFTRQPLHLLQSLAAGTAESTSQVATLFFESSSHDVFAAGPQGHVFVLADCH
ncbi:hypothetical protein PMIN01_06682 [Paraphaeosphaeria minitans]|uniref:Uncharacterized protein n=1 Tax=Paraphaeosphaeria minitans TaxID=565426 RepID=A0A9P6KQM0_9PLEO|nr:hypothetical protein PMIN01_06682 [Paraphaeosphaeria minitans]